MGSEKLANRGRWMGTGASSLAPPSPGPPESLFPEHTLLFAISVAACFPIVQSPAPHLSRLLLRPPNTTQLAQGTLRP